MKIKKKYPIILFVLFLSLSVVFISLIQIKIDKIQDLRQSALQDIFFQDFELEVNQQDSGTFQSINLKGTYYHPKEVDDQDSISLVVLQHGMGGRKENLHSMAFCFVKRGFAALTLNLRNHYNSQGHTTLGHKESQDLLKGINFMKERMDQKGVKIEKVGLVGHSLGALTVSLAGMSSNINSTVAIAPPGDITSMFGDLTGIDIEQLGNTVDGFNPFSDPEYVSNITLLGKNPPRNYLMIAGEGDSMIYPSHVEALFQNITGDNDKEPFKLYGSFEENNAVQYNVYNVPSHGAEQFAFQTPQITEMAINWTETALNITNEDPLDINQYQDLGYFEELYSIWATVGGDYLLLMVFSLLCLYFFFLVVGNVKRMEINPIPAMIRLRHNFASMLREKKGNSFNFFLLISFLLSLVFGTIFLALEVSFSKFLGLHLLLSILYPICLSLLISVPLNVYYLKNKERKEKVSPPIEDRDQKKAKSDRKSDDIAQDPNAKRVFLENSKEYLREFSQAFKNPSKFLKKTVLTIFGILTSILSIISWAFFSQQAKAEALLKPTPEISGFPISVVQVVLLTIGIEILFSFRYRVFLKITKKSQSNRTNSMLLTPIFGFLVSLVLFMIYLGSMNLDSPYLQAPMFFLMSLLIFGYFLLIEITNKINWIALVNQFIGTVAVPILFSWIMSSLLLAY